MLSPKSPPKLGLDTDVAPDNFVTSAGIVYVAVEAVEAVVWVALTVTLSGSTPVALPPKYQLPMSVKLP